MEILDLTGTPMTGSVVKAARITSYNVCYTKLLRTVALDAAKNAGILAAQIISTYDENVAAKLADFKVEMREKVLASAKELKDKGF